MVRFQDLKTDEMPAGICALTDEIGQGLPSPKSTGGSELQL